MPISLGRMAPPSGKGGEGRGLEKRRETWPPPLRLYRSPPPFEGKGARTSSCECVYAEVQITHAVC